MSGTDITPGLRELCAAIADFELALARAQEAHNIIPAGSTAAVSGIREVALDAAALERGLADDGVVVPALLAQWRAALPDGVGGWLHWGVTSQDAIDSAYACLHGARLDMLRMALEALVRALIGLADEQRSTPMAARTRHRSATPVSFGFLVSGWLAPLVRGLRQLSAIRSGVTEVQLGGSGGVAGGFADPVALAEAVAADLGLTAARVSWQSQRDAVVAGADWLQRISGSVAKAAGDLLFLGGDEVGEVSFASSGGSSTMPHKQNPVRLERCVASYRLVSAQSGIVREAQVGLMQRDGRSWPLEGAALLVAMDECVAQLESMRSVLENLVVHEERMITNLEAGSGVPRAEQARFLLSAHMPPDTAAEVVREAVEQVSSAGGRFLERLAAHPRAAGFDLTPLSGYAPELSNAEVLIDRVIAQARRMLATG